MTQVLAIGPRATRRLLRQILEAERDIAVVHEIEETAATLPLLQTAAPHVVVICAAALSTNGLLLIEEIMSEGPRPIIILSDFAHDPKNATVTEAIRRGALAAHALPVPSDTGGAAALRSAIRQLAKIPVVRHPRSHPAPKLWTPPLPCLPAPAVAPTSVAELVGIGSSAGGPAILVEILTELPPSFGAALLVVQHLPSGFAAHFAEFLRARGRLPVSVATEPLPLTPGQIILAPDDAHLVVTARGQCGSVASPPVNGHRPSVDMLFESMARSYGAAAVGVILSGIGSDGTAGLRAIRDRGGLTIAQSPETAAVDGMPRSARDSGAATRSLWPAAIAAVLQEVCAPAIRGSRDGD